MATSGYRDEYVTKWDTLRFSWSRTSYSIPNNTSVISWKLQLISTAYGAINSSAAKTWAVTVNGTSYSGTTSIAIGNNTTKILASGSTTVSHNNDGTKTFAYSFSQVFNITFSNNSIGTIKGSSSGTLDSIPRYASITDAPNFNDETTNLTIKFNNPGNFDLKLKIEAGGDTALIVRDKVTKTSPYTFVLTEEEKKKLRKKCTKNSMAVRFTVVTYLNGVESNWSCIDKTMTLINYTPTLDPTVIDVGTVSTTLTGDPNILIMNYSIARVTFNSSAEKEATIANEKVTCGNDSRNSDGDMNYISSGTFIFTVTDSRGNSASKTITKDVIDYIPLTCNLYTDTDIIDGSNANINLTINGQYFDGSFGAVTNSLTVEYRYKINDGSYPTDENGDDIWTSITGTPSDGKYTAQATINGLDYTNLYTFQARAKDKAYTNGVIATEQIVKIAPVFDWGENDFNFNVPVSAPCYNIKNTGLGGLIGYGCIYNNSSNSTSIADNTRTAFSDFNTESSYSIFVDNGLIVFDSGTFAIYPKNIVEMVEVELTLSGSLDSGCYAIWFLGNKDNQLIPGVNLIGNPTDQSSGRSLLSIGTGSYGGTSHKYVYVVDKSTTFSDTDHFYVNPTFLPYGGSFTPNNSGTKSMLTVKLYSRRG